MKNHLKKNYARILLVVLSVLVLAGILVLDGYLYGRNVISKAGTNLKFGFVTDWEYGYKESVGNKPTSKAPEALRKAVDHFNDEFQPEIVIAGGDMVESSLAKKDTATRQFQEINMIFSELRAKRGYVFGNHDLRKLSKEELRNILGMDGNHSYFDQGDWRFVLMDTNFKKDGTDLGPNQYVEGFVPESEFAWLREAFDTDRPIILFSHHSSIPNELDGRFVTKTKNLANGIQLHDFLKQYPNLVLFVSGHEPGYRFKNAEGVNYLIGGELASFEILGSFLTLEAKYNRYTKEAKIAVEKHGERAGKFEIGKTIGAYSPWAEIIKILKNDSGLF